MLEGNGFITIVRYERPDYLPKPEIVGNSITVHNDKESFEIRTKEIRPGKEYYIVGR